MLNSDWEYTDAPQNSAQNAIDAAYLAWAEAVEAGYDVSEVRGETEEINNKRRSITAASRALRDVVTAQAPAIGAGIAAEIFTEVSALDEAFRVFSAGSSAGAPMPNGFAYGDPLLFSIRSTVYKCCMKAKSSAATPEPD